jgi:hypothetical protein
MTVATSAFAQTQQVCFTGTIPLENTNWQHNVSISKFDAGLGTLQTIDFTVSATVIGSAAEESLDSTPSVVTLQFSSMVELTRPDGSMINVTIPSATFMDTLSAFDGVLDFGGTSGVTHSNIVASNSTTFSSPPPASDLVLFTGPAGNPGTISLPVTAAGTSIAMGSGNIQSQFTQQASAQVQVCYTYLPNTPPTFTTCNATVMASAGVPFTFQICASDSDANDVVTITSATGLPAGAQLTPPLPVSGNPVCTTLTWTPASNQVGTTSITFQATDTHLRTASCTLNIVVAECHMLFAGNSGNSQQTIFGHLYDTQLAGLRRFYPVTMEAHPSFPFRFLPSNFFVQVVMYNPEVFPQNPSQWSYAMQVQPDQPSATVQLTYYGTQNGISLTAEVFIGQSGLARIRFPFAIL